MNATKLITVRLDVTDYERLAAEARRLGLPPSTLARIYVHVGLAENRRTTEDRRQAGMIALAGLVALRERLPEAGPVDVVNLIREGREELDRRTEL